MISRIIIFSFGLFLVKCEEEAMLSAVTVNEKYLAKLVSRSVINYKKKTFGFLSTRQALMN